MGAVEEKAERLGVRSATGAQAAAFESHKDGIARRAAAFRLQPGQCGAVLGLAGTPVCVDFVSRPEVWADLHDKILAGYTLDALEHADAAETAEAALYALVDGAFALRRETHSGGRLRAMPAHRGRGARRVGPRVDGELIQLSAHAR